MYDEWYWWRGITAGYTDGYVSLMFRGIDGLCNVEWPVIFLFSSLVKELNPRR